MSSRASLLLLSIPVVTATFSENCCLGGKPCGLCCLETVELSGIPSTAHKDANGILLEKTPNITSSLVLSRSLCQSCVCLGRPHGKHLPEQHHFVTSLLLIFSLRAAVLSWGSAVLNPGDASDKGACRKETFLLKNLGRVKSQNKHFLKVWCPSLERK